MINKTNWDETRKKWDDYWKHKNTGRPLMCVIARKPELEKYAGGVPAVVCGYRDVICQGMYYNLPEELKWKSLEDKYFDAERIVGRYRYFCETHEFLGESFPNLNIDFGPGSLAVYLGSSLDYNEDTVWFGKIYEDMEEAPEIVYNKDNDMLIKHLELARRCRELAGEDFLIDMPDLMENLDVIASLHGSSETLIDLLDIDDEMKKRVGEIDKVYYPVFDRFYDIIKDSHGGNAYTVFQIYGSGKTTKLQCDISAMMSPESFREFVQPSLRWQAAQADNVLYHLDGKEAIRHLDALLEIEGIDAIQWTSGDTAPDGTFPQWDIIYDKTIAAGKSIWVKVYTDGFDQWIERCDRIVKKYGSHSLFFLFPEMSLDEAHRLLRHAEEHWSNVKGTYCEELGLR